MEVEKGYAVDGFHVEKGLQILIRCAIILWDVVHKQYVRGSSLVCPPGLNGRLYITGKNRRQNHGRTFREKTLR